MAITYEKIAATTLTVETTSLTFNNIPTSYNDLVLRCSTRLDLASNYANGQVLVNGDNTNIYSNTPMGAIGTTMLFNRGQNQPFITVYSAGTSTADLQSSSEMYIANYNATTRKQPWIFEATESPDANNLFRLNGARVNLSSALTSITLRGVNNDPLYGFVAGSVFTLYGIKTTV